MPKNICLALTISLFSILDISLGSASPTRQSRTSSVSQHTRRSIKKTTAKHSTSSKGRTSARAASPWHLSSYGDSTLGDNPLGEDPSVRAAAIEALGNYNGAVVVLDPNNGRILSIVNQKLALTGAFTPCSTFKPVVATAALKEGIITEDTKLLAESRFRVYYGTQRISLAQALAHSSNMFFAKLGEMLGFRRVTEYARQFGLGERAGWNIPGESPGWFPPAPPKEGGVGLLTSFGQDIEITPLQLAAAVSAIANGGTLYYLQYPRTPDEIVSFRPEVRRHLDDVAPYLPKVKSGMAAAVLYGTGRSAYSPDEPIFGKTGTCSEAGAHLGWFGSFSGDPASRYVVVVLLRGGKLMFGPHAAEIAGLVYRGMMAREKASASTSARALLPAFAGL